MVEKPTLALSERLSFALVGLRIVCVLLFNVATGAFRGERGASTFRKHIVYSTFRAYLGMVTVHQSQAISPFTKEVYEAFAKQKSFCPETVQIAHGARCCWMGDRRRGTVILWFHGGGYSATATLGHFDLIWGVTERANAEGAGLSCCFLDYCVAPGATYPTQLKQAIAVLEYLTEKENIPLSRIVLGGDSAGGNLALALLSHLSHPHPSLALLNTTGEFKSVLLLSPWVTFKQTARSYADNAKKDILNLQALKKWSDNFMFGAVEDNYNSPLGADASWWNSIKAQDVCILGGQDKVFKSDIESLVEKFKVHNDAKLTVFMAEGEVHDAPVLDVVLGIPPGLQKEAFHQWVLERAGVEG